jgi:hypothetical protein
MVLSVAIGIVSLLIALNGLIYQPKKDPSGPATWSNISRLGKCLFALILIINLLNVAKTIYDSEEQSREVNRRDKAIKELLESQRSLTATNEVLKSTMKLSILQQAELREINQHLIKVMSVADGYNATIRGVVRFRGNVSESQIRGALTNLLLKYARVEIKASNKLGTYSGRIDSGAHPEVRKFLALSQKEDGYISSKYRDMPAGSYYFEIRCSKLKILSNEKIQYAQFHPNDRLQVLIRHFEWSKDFGRLYNVAVVLLDEIEIEELQKVPIGKTLYF